jgi:hypothetical protein
MPDFSSMGKWLMALGLGLVIIGGAVFFSGKIPFLGRLPGDIKIEKENFSFYFPLATCLLLSILGSLLFWLFSKFK